MQKSRYSEQRFLAEESGTFCAELTWRTEGENSMPGFSTTLAVNSLFWITSLRPTEHGVTRRIQEDLLPYLDSIGLHHHTFQPQTATELLAILSDIAQQANVGLRPILHFDTHGDLAQGLRLAASGEFISWSVLIFHLRAINVATGNNLCVVSGACFSLNAVWEINLSEACPFFILIASGKEVSAGFLADKTFAFYKSAFEGLEIVAAHERHLAPHLSLHHCERVLAYDIANYIRDSCTGKGRRIRREELMTRAVTARIAQNRQARRKVRQGAKKWTRPNQAMVDRYVNGVVSKFLMGKPPGFDINDVMRLVKSDNDRSARVRAPIHLPDKSG